MIIKQIPEDFIVKEVSTIDFKDSGRYTYYILKKQDYTTLKSCQVIARTLKAPLREIGYAGSKDRRAITEQIISIKKGPREIIVNKDISVTIIGYSDVPLSLGMLQGNSFFITVRDLDSIPDLHCTKIVNYFGKQRFSQRNVEIGTLLLKRKFGEALAFIEEDHSVEEKDSPVNTLKGMPTRLLLLYVHSVQSWIWNKAAKFCVENDIEIDSLPLVGFSSTIEGTEAMVVERFMKEIGVVYSDFLIRQFPEISCEGTERMLYGNVSNFKVMDSGEDELNNGKKKVTVSFYLPKGCYATEVIDQVLSE